MVISLLAQVEPVHTTGINIASVVTIISGITVLVSVIVGGFLRQQSKAIARAVEQLGNKLESRLETKDKVAELAAQVAGLKSEIRYLNKDSNSGAT